VLRETIQIVINIPWNRSVHRHGANYALTLVVVQGAGHSSPPAGFLLLNDRSRSI
jgi:hypothetical protein